MIERYALLAERLHQEVTDLAQVVDRVEKAMSAARQHPDESGFYLDSVALNLHDFYAGLERALRRIAAVVDGSVPDGPAWHRDLLRQMSVAVPKVRPRVLSAEVAGALDEYLRFRHVVRNVYAFQFDPERLGYLVRQLRPTFKQAEAELLAFADFLEALAHEA